ncbi:MAG: helix-turn-helix transcriptional regulator [Candidatus Omnitrophota bacterium]|nr:helix-turn-helix transcriptional regulator [Candidatus Omnitrophota bacterium]MBU2528821.1 helix-turn-helix transcriptional regulator [bacterium]MBU3930402.1 helix-turn-helix transcriptional regulator [bacterium]MBU4123253.1 helix-turn-helix transcriptional regulator [bacterium]
MKKFKVRKFRDRLKEELKSGEFSVEFKKEYDLVKLGVTLVELRKAQGLTQRQLAKLIHTSQQAISKLENAEGSGCNISTLTKIAAATNTHLKLSFSAI